MKFFLNALEIFVSLTLITALIFGIAAADHYTRVASLQSHFMQDCLKEVGGRGEQTPQQAEFFCYRAIYSGTK